MRRLAILDREAEIRRYRPADEPAVLDLYHASFEAGARDKLVEREWRYVHNPEGAHRTMVCALDDGSLICAYTGIPLRASLLGRPGTVSVMVDAMTHPAYRGAMLGRRGVFARTVHAWIEEFTVDRGPFQFCFGVPQRRHARLGRLLMGYDLWDRLGYFTRALDDSWIKRVRRALPEPRVERPDRFGEAAEELWRRLAPAYPSGVIRDGRYLRWRYDQCPGHDYVRLALRRAGGGWDGWLVLSVDGAKATLVDALLPPELPRGAPALLYRALGEALERGATEMEAWAGPETPLERLLLDAGFWKGTYEGVSFACRLFDESLDADVLREQWYFQPGDTDDH